MSDGGGMGSSAMPIYQKFIRQAKKLHPRYLTMIVPSRWFTGGRGLDDFRNEMLHDERIRVIHDYINENDCFPGVTIKGGVCYFLWDRDNKEKKELSAEEKEYKSKRKDIQDKLIKFATRIPIFMYLTDFREYSLKDVITQLEQGLFKRVTGLNVKDFELLVSLGVFNDGLMNDAVYKFKRYEDSSLSYTGIDKHAGKAVGGYDTVLTREEYDRLFGSQQISISEATQAFDDLPDIDYDITEDDDEDDVDTPQGKAPVSQKPASQTKPIPVQPNKDTSAVAKPQISSASLKRNDDYSFVKPGLIVTHKTFGEGRVIKFLEDKRDKKIIIAFGKAEKMFMFPDAFKSGFLNLQ